MFKRIPVMRAFSDRPVRDWRWWEEDNRDKFFRRLRLGFGFITMNGDEEVPPPQPPYETEPPIHTD